MQSKLKSIPGYRVLLFTIVVWLLFGSWFIWNAMPNEVKDYETAAIGFLQASIHPHTITSYSPPEIYVMDDQLLVSGEATDDASRLIMYACTLKRDAKGQWTLAIPITMDVFENTWTLKEDESHFYSTDDQISFNINTVKDVAPIPHGHESERMAMVWDNNTNQFRWRVVNDDGTLGADVSGKD